MEINKTIISVRSNNYTNEEICKLKRTIDDLNEQNMILLNENKKLKYTLNDMIFEFEKSYELLNGSSLFKITKTEINKNLIRIKCSNEIFVDIDFIEKKYCIKKLNFIHYIELNRYINANDAINDLINYFQYERDNIQFSQSNDNEKSQLLIDRSFNNILLLKKYTNSNYICNLWKINNKTFKVDITNIHARSNKILNVLILLKMHVNILIHLNRRIKIRNLNYIFLMV